MTDLESLDGDFENEIRGMLRRRATTDIPEDTASGQPAGDGDAATPTIGRRKVIHLTELRPASADITLAEVASGPRTGCGAVTGVNGETHDPPGRVSDLVTDGIGDRRRAGWRARAGLAAACIGTAAAAFAVVGRALPEPAPGPVEDSTFDTAAVALSAAAAQLPNGTLAAARPVHVGDLDPISTGEGYLADRLPEAGTAVEPTDSLVDADSAALRWHGQQPEPSAAGWLFLARDDSGRWAVIAATTDGIDAGDTAIDRPGGLIAFNTEAADLQPSVQLIDLASGRPADVATGDLTIGDGPAAAFSMPLLPPVPDAVGVRIIGSESGDPHITEFALTADQADSFKPVDDVAGGTDRTEGPGDRRDDETRDSVAVDDPALATHPLRPLLPAADTLGPGYRGPTVELIDGWDSPGAETDLGCPAAGLDVADGLYARYAWGAVADGAEVAITRGSEPELNRFAQSVDQHIGCRMSEGSDSARTAEPDAVAFDPSATGIAGALSIRKFTYVEPARGERSDLLVRTDDLAFYLSTTGDAPVGVVALALELFEAHQAQGS